MKKMLLFLGMIFMLSFSVTAQSWLNKLGNKAKEAAKQAVENRVENKADEAANKAMDKAEKSVTNEGKENEETPVNDDLEMQSGESPDNKSGDGTPTLQSYSRYDFVPGDKILFYEDFSQDAIGDFPALWTSNSGGEVKTVNIAGGNWFHLNGEDAVYCYMREIAFTDNFIVEFDIIPDKDYQYGTTLTLYQDNPEDPKELNDDLYPGMSGLRIRLKNEGWETLGYSDSKDWLEGKASLNPVRKEKSNHVIIWIQKRRVRIYHEGQKVLDSPTNIYAGTRFNRFLFTGWDSYSMPYITNLKISTASPDTRNKLITEGKLVSYGIYFDVNKADVKAESYSSLNEIAKVLQENAGVRVKIVGHTDSDGDDLKNLDLSRRRGEAVKSSLAKEFGIDPSRMESDGAGESEPVAANDIPVNKALNRRVEFVKL